MNEHENGGQNILLDDNVKKPDLQQQVNSGASQSAETQEVDPYELRINPDLITAALAKFCMAKEEMELLEENQGKNKKKKKALNDKEDEERNRKRDMLKYTNYNSILSEQKQSVWRSLDKSMTKYYGLLVDRQNLIEETGLLNQQNEELKTLLNQYLQSGVNQELQVPPTQVISLNIR